MKFPLSPMLLSRAAKYAYVVMLLASSPAFASAADTNEVWLSATATVNGNGTFASPFWASTQARFDSTMKALCANSNMTIHLFPGTYETTGFDSGNQTNFTLKSGTKLIGAGINNTKIKRINSLGESGYITVIVAREDRTEISDLTIDCGGLGQKRYAHNAINVTGTDSRVRNVLATNVFGTASGPASASYQETFAFVTMPRTPVKQGMVFSDCVARDFHPEADYVSGFLVNGSVALERCRVYLPAPETWNTNGHTGFNIGSANNATITHCYVEGGKWGVYHDTGYLTNFTVSFSMFTNVVGGFIHQSPDYVDGVRVLYNDFYLLPVKSKRIDNTSGITFWAFVDPKTKEAKLNKNIDVIGNHIEFADRRTTMPYSLGVLGLNFYGIEGKMSNVFASLNTMSSNFSYQSLGTNIIFHANRGTDGKFFPQMNESLPLPHRTITKSGKHTLLITDSFVSINIGSNNTVTLPSNAGYPGKELIIVNEATNGTTITVAAGAGESIHPSPSPLGSNSSIRLISNGKGKWFRL